jgi:hypothetical protein
VTLAEACAGATAVLPGIFPGSWIDGNFYIWIGHPDDHKAWSQLAEARNVLDQITSAGAHGLDPAAVAEAREELFIAEGSDWFWWYGDDHSSAHDLEFDDLFRRHVRNAYQRLQVPIPDELFVSNISTAAGPAMQTEPNALLAPTIDGEETSYFEWLGAGTLEIREVAGAMHQTDRHQSLVTLVHFGFDRERLFVRVDSSQRIVDLLASGRELSLKFFAPGGVRFSVRQSFGRLTGTFWDRQGQSPEWTERGPGGAAAAAGTVLEVALPIADLGVSTGQPVSFFVAVYDDGGAEIERHPAHRPIELMVPDDQFEARQWHA